MKLTSARILSRLLPTDSNSILDRPELKQPQLSFQSPLLPSRLRVRKQRETKHSTFSTLGFLVHATLQYGASFLDFAPVPGLAGVARTILKIWDTLEGVMLSRSACERLAELCEDLMLSVSREVKRVGDVVDEDLMEPLRTLDESCKEVLAMLEKNKHLSFIDRFLRKDEIERDIEDLEIRLKHYIDKFDRAVWIRIFMQTRDIHQETQDIRNMLLLLLACQSVLPRNFLPNISQEDYPALDFPVRYALAPAPDTPGVLASV